MRGALRRFFHMSGIAAIAKISSNLEVNGDASGFERENLLIGLAGFVEILVGRQHFGMGQAALDFIYFGQLLNLCDGVVFAAADDAQGIEQIANVVALGFEVAGVQANSGGANS